MTAILLAAVLAKAPDFTLRALDGRTVRLSDYRGKVVLLNFWATWCAGCRIEIPRLVAQCRQYRSRGLEIIGVSMDDGDEEMIGKFAKLKGINYPIVKGNAAVAKAYGGVRFLPQTFVIGRDGAILKSIAGVPDAREFDQLIERSVTLKQSDGRPLDSQRTPHSREAADAGAHPAIPRRASVR
ncbi:MAG: TlpA family protein disulfide reductase [Acidobacteriota bacterium]|nr:TlpA family protein disulfide reductase [Acidobacteriota bacterium]